MNKRSYALAVVALLALLASACAPGAVGAEAAKRTVSVTGTGKVTLSPDLARVSIGVNTMAEEADEAVAENNAKTEKVIETLESFEIASEDIQTTGFSVYPQQNWREGEIVGVTYQVYNTVQVTVRELDSLGEILDAVVGAGANSINGIQFDVADREAAYSQALEAALENARQRAETVAGAAEVGLGEVQSIDTSVSGGGIVVPFERVALEAAEAGGEVPVSEGQLEITAQVSVVYEIR